MTFELLCMGLIGLMFGLAVTFLGYRLFLILLPIWGFFFGFFLGAETVQVIFGIGFLATVTSWVAGFFVGVVVAVLVVVFNIQKYAIIVITALGGTAAIIFTLLGLFGGFTVPELLLGPVRLAIRNSFWWLLFFLVVAGAGIVVQIRANRHFEIDTYNRLAEA